MSPALKGLLVLMFAIASGFTLSGIVANLYRLLASKPKNAADTAVYYAVMVVAGPSVLFDNAPRSFRRKECTGIALAIALGLATYWAMVLGAILLDLVVSI